MVNKTIYVTSPPRTGNNFLTTLINGYVIQNNIPNIKCSMSGHKHLFFKNDNKNVYNILILRNPKDILISQFIFEHGEVKYNEIETRVGYFKAAFSDHLNEFKESNKPNNYWVNFDNLISNPENILRSVIHIIGEEYNTKKFNNPIHLENKHNWANDIYKNPLPINRKENDTYQKLYSIYSVIAEEYDLSDVNDLYKNVMALFDNKEIK